MQKQMPSALHVHGDDKVLIFWSSSVLQVLSGLQSVNAGVMVLIANGAERIGRGCRLVSAGGGCLAMSESSHCPIMTGVLVKGNRGLPPVPKPAAAERVHDAQSVFLPQVVRLPGLRASAGERGKEQPAKQADDGGAGEQLTPRQR